MNKIEQLFAKAREKAAAIKTLLEGDSPDMEQIKALQAEADALIAQAEALKAAQATIDKASKPVLPAPLPMGADPDPEPEKDSAIKAVYNLRFGETDAAVKAILQDLHGPDYEQKRWAQVQGFTRYLRTGLGESREMIWTPALVKLAIQDGQDVKGMKAVMVEGADVLGGYAVPEDWRAEVISRMSGYTVVRPLARVISTSRDRVEFPKMTGGGSQYRDAVRVTWVDETPTAATAATNLTMRSEVVPVHTVMAETFLSRNLVEDAAFPIVNWLTDSFAEAQGIDEDNQFLVGDGNGKPQGVLADSGISALGTGQQVVSGSNSTVTADGLIDLVYSLDAQYRQRAVFVAEKATYKAIRKLKDGEGNYIWERNFQVNQPDRLLGYPVREQEGMPTIAQNAFPIIFGDFQGYYIADRIGMSVERYLGGEEARINQVLYVARRRVGGQAVATWRFVAQKIST